MKRLVLLIAALAVLTFPASLTGCRTVVHTSISPPPVVYVQATPYRHHSYSHVRVRVHPTVIKRHVVHKHHHAHKRHHRKAHRR